MSPSDFCCDAIGHLKKCEFIIVEDKKSNIYHAIEQLESVHKAIKYIGHNIKAQIISGDNLNRRSKQNYTINQNVLKSKENKRPVMVEGQPVFFIKYGESIKNLWTKIINYQNKYSGVRK